MSVITLEIASSIPELYKLENYIAIEDAEAIKKKMKKLEKCNIISAPKTSVISNNKKYFICEVLK